MLRKLPYFIRLIGTPAPAGGGDPTPEPDGAREEPQGGIFSAPAEVFPQSPRFGARDFPLLGPRGGDSLFRVNE